jgi:hypothetical protein
MHKARKILPFAGVAAGLYAVMLLFTHGVMHGYVTRVPDPGDVRGVYVWHHGHWSWQREGWDFVYINDRNVIARTMDAHRQIIEERRSLRPLLWLSMTRRWHITPTDRFPITYQLHNGRTLQRVYRLPRDFMRASGIEALIRDEAVILSRHPELLMPTAIDKITIRLPHITDTERLGGTAFFEINEGSSSSPTGRKSIPL